MSKKSLLDFNHKFFLDSTLSLSPKIYKAFSAAFERGVILNHQIKLEDYNHLEMGFGIKTMEEITPFKEIIRIPIDIGFNGLDLIDFKEDISKKAIKDLCWKIARTFYPNHKFRQEKNFQNQMLMWQIILNTYYKEAYNYELVDTFPSQDMAQPVYATKQIYDSISSPNLRKYYYENRLYLQNIFDMISKEAIYEFSFDQVAWAYNNALARKLIIIEPNSESPYQLILPVADFINHSSVSANVYAEAHYNNIEKESSISIKASRHITENEQLLFDYGPMYNKKFVSMYGFFDKDNPLVETEFYFIGRDVQHWLEFNYDIEVSVYDQFLKFLNSFQQDKKEILVKNSLVFENYYPEYNLMVYCDKFDTKFIKFLRIIYLEDEDILNNQKEVNSHDFSNLYSFANEKKVLIFLKFMLDRYYSFVKHINHQEKIHNLGPIENVDKYKTKCMILLEAEEKILLEKNLNYIIRKMKSLF